MQQQKSVVGFNLKCSEEDKQVCQSREEGKQEETRETGWGIDKQIIVCKELLCLFSPSFPRLQPLPRPHPPTPDTR